MTIAAIFDMDRTVLNVDTAMSWTRFLYARGELSRTMLVKAAYWSALYKLALLDMEEVFTRLVEDLRGPGRHGRRAHGCVLTSCRRHQLLPPPPPRPRQRA